jgi:hypothetical protein
MSITKEKSPARITTDKVRLSYFKGWKPEAMEEGGEKKYSTALLIDKEDEKTLGRIKTAVDYLTVEAKKKYGGKLPVKFKLPLRDGDEERDDDDYAGKFWLNANSKNKPRIVDLNMEEIKDESKVYSGCYARVSLNFFLFDTKGNKGIGVGLNNIQKVKDGEPLSGGSNPEDDFAEAIEMDDDEDI